MASKRVKSHLQTVNEIPIPKILPSEYFREALQYKPRADDVFVATYPKCGTTWVQNIVLLIFRKGEPLADDRLFFSHSPHLELIGVNGVLDMPRPGAMKSHLPLNIIPYDPLAKYITVTRNPKDCCVSFYHHCRSTPGLYDTEISFDDFFELFMNAEVPYGDYFNHTLTWYEHRKDPNVLYLIYEDMKEDTAGAVIRVAKFLGTEYGEMIQKDSGMLNRILQYVSFEYMKVHTNASHSFRDECGNFDTTALQSPSLPQAIKDVARNIESLGIDVKTRKLQMVRKGQVGDWRNYFSLEQSRRVDERFAKTLGHTILADIWKEDMLI